jgi:hypothetical protein
MLKNRKVRAWITGGLGFFLTITIFITVGCAELLLGICSNVTLRRSVRESNYAERAYDEFAESASDLLQTNEITIDSEILFPEKDVMFAFSNYEEAVYNHKQAKSNVENIVGSVEVAMWEYLATNGINVTDTMEAGIKRKSTAIGEMYAQYMEPVFLEKLHEITYSRRNSLKVVMLVGGILSVGIIVLLLLSFRHKHKALRYMVSACLAAGVWNLITMFLCFTQLKATELGIASSAYECFLNEYVVGIQIPFFIVTAVLFLTSGMLFYLLKRLRQQS